MKAHTTWRWLTCPFPAVAALVPPAGRILDLGCGHGHFAMYLAVTGPQRSVLGVDIDAAKIEIGHRSVARAGLAERVELRPVNVDWRPDDDTFDAVVTNDVLYLMGRERARDMLAFLPSTIRPGGRVVIKETGTSPRWKYRINEVQERLATRVLRITAGTTVETLSDDEIEGPLRAGGLLVRRHQLDHGYPHAHVAYVGVRG